MLRVARVCGRPKGWLSLFLPKYFTKYVYLTTCGETPATTRPITKGPAHQKRRAAAACGEYCEAAGAVGKALKLWRNDPTAYPFDSNNVAAITRVLFQSRHAWFRHRRCRYFVDRCGGAVLVLSVATRYPEPSRRI